MEPDYSSYSMKDLLEAYESVDRNAYPRRLEKIETALKQHSDNAAPKTLVGHFQNHVFTGVLVLTLLFLAGVWGSYDLWQNGFQELEQLAFPAMLLLSPLGVWQAQVRWNKHQNDYIAFDNEGVTYQELDTEKRFVWAEVDSVWFARVRYRTSVSISTVSGDCISVYLVHFGLEASQLKRILVDKSSTHNFRIKRYIMGLIPVKVSK